MAKKQRRNTPQPAREFRTTPFTGLKGVKVAEAAPAPRAKEQQQPRAELDADDHDLFLHAMAGATPLHPIRQPRQKPGNAEPEQALDGRCPPRKARQPSVEEQEADLLFVQEIKRLKLEARFGDSLPDDGELRPLAGNRLKQLKRGIVSVDRQLDLHGLTREEALLALPRFLLAARSAEQKAVLVITGKGNNSPGEPILQQAVASWLRDAGKDLVLEFAPAPREMGGSGAFVVFIRPAPTPPPPF